MNIKTSCITILTSLLVLAYPYAQAATICFSDFSDASILTLNGTATTTTTGDGEVLRLAGAYTSQSGSASSTATISATNFSTAFTFRITEPGGVLADGNTEPGADGIVFVAQAVSSDIGGMGQGIGYSGISPSVGVEFDTWHNSANNDPDSNHVGIDINGNVNHGDGSPNTASVATRFDDGNIWYAWIDYDGTTMEVRANQTGLRPEDALLSRDLDLVAILGQNTAYVGFTSGTGGDWGNHDILTWEYIDSYAPIGAVPVPAAVWLFGSGLLGLVGMARRKKA